MIEFQNTVIILPVRMASQGLPGKAMVDLNGKPLVVHAWSQVRDARLGNVIVGAPELPIIDTIKKAGGEAIVIPASARTQIERAAAILEMRDPARILQHVVIMSPDMPFLDANTIRRCLAGLTNSKVDGAVVVAPVESEETLNDSGAIKVIAPLSETREVAYVRDYFRQVPEDLVPSSWQYAGISAYRRNALERLAATPQTQNEFARAIGMMRALDSGLRMAAVLIDEPPLRVNSRETLERARTLMRVVQ
jgi:3-deoxy-manno-octulosonate cytidylyltransferase (CMP-KDO synthetase)